MQRPLATLIGLLLLAGILRAPAIVGPGYSLDEEITVFAVRGVRAAGLPLFPSGVLSDRGLPYSYAAWIAGALFGHDLSSYRLVSTMSGLAAVAVFYLAARRVVSEVAAASAALLLAVLPLHIAVSGWARFYALAVAGFVTSVGLFLTLEQRRDLRRWFIASVAASVLLHELCSVLVVLPLLAALTTRDNREMRREWTRTFIWCAAAACAVRLAVAACHFLAPNQSLNPWLYQGATLASRSPAGAFPLIAHASTGLLVMIAVVLTMGYVALVLRYKAPPVFLAVCLSAAGLFHLGVLAIATLVAVMLHPARTRAYLGIGAIATAVSAAFWTIQTWTVTSAALSLELLRSLVVFSVSYTLDAALFFFRALPLTSMVIVVVVSWNVGGGSRIDTRARVLGILLVVCFALLPALNLAPNSRYFVVFWPLVLFLVAHGLDGLWRTGAPPTGRWSVWLRGTATAALVVGLAIEQRSFSRHNPVLMTGSSPRLGTVERVQSSGWADPLSTIPANAKIISNDELASVYHIGRIDYWLTSNEWDLARFEILTPTGRYGEYAGARVISTADSLRQLAGLADSYPLFLVLFRTGRFEFEDHRRLGLELAREYQRDVISDVPGLFVLSIAASRGR